MGRTPPGPTASCACDEWSYPGRRRATLPRRARRRPSRRAASAAGGASRPGGAARAARRARGRGAARGLRRRGPRRRRPVLGRHRLGLDRPPAAGLRRAGRGARRGAARGSAPPGARRASTRTRWRGSRAGRPAGGQAGQQFGRRGPPLRAGPRPLRGGLPVSPSMHCAHPARRGAARGLAPRTRRAPSRSAPGKVRCGRPTPLLDLREDLAVLGEAVQACGRPGRALATGGGPRPPCPASSAPRPWPSSALRSRGRRCGRSTGSPVPLAVAAALGIGFRLLVRRRVEQVLARLDRPSAELRCCRSCSRGWSGSPSARATWPRSRLGSAPAAGRPRAGSPSSRGSPRAWNGRQNQFFAPIAFLLQWTALHAAAVERWREACGAGPRGLARRGRRARGALRPGRVRPRPARAPVPRDRGPRAGAAGLLRRRRPAPPAARRRGRQRRAPRRARVPRPASSRAPTCPGRAPTCERWGWRRCWARPAPRWPAARCRFTPLMPGATLRIQDSLLAGRSRFFAEVTRLRALQDLAGGEVPLLFLLDELLHGTNSHDRRIGAEAVLSTLLAQGAIGLVTTHDLALTELAATVRRGRQRALRGPGDRRGDRLRLPPARGRGAALQRAWRSMRAVGLRV